MPVTRGFSGSPRCPMCATQMFTREVDGGVKAWWCEPCGDGFAYEAWPPTGPDDDFDRAARCF